MTTFEITSPDGAVYQVDGPEGSTEEQAMQQVMQEHNTPVAKDSSLLDKTEHLAGLGARHFYKGVAGLADAIPGAINLAQFIEEKVTGNPQEYLPMPISQLMDKYLEAIKVPQAQTSGEKLLGAAVQGAAGGGIIGPVGAMSGAAGGMFAQEAENMGMGPGAQVVAGLVGGIAPTSTALVAGRAAGATANVVKQGIQPFTQSGRNQIVGQSLKEASTDPALAVQNLKSAKEYIPGSPVTTGEASGDIGLKAAERGLRGNSPNAFSDIKSQQNAAQNKALEDIAGTPQTINTLKEAREAGAGTIRDEAFKKFNEDPRIMDTEYRTFKKDVQERVSSFKDVDLNKKTGIGQLSDMLTEYGYTLKKSSSTSGKSNIYTATKTDPVTNKPVVFSFRVGENPLPKNINKDYIDLASADGLKNLTNTIAKSEPTKPGVNPNFARGIAQRRLEAPEGNLTDVQIAMKTAQQRISNAINIGNPEYAYSLRKDLAQDVAGKLAEKAGGAGFDAGKYRRLAGRQLKDLLESLDTQIEKAAPGYKEYMTKYAEMSRPIEQQELLQELHKKITTNASPDLQTGYQFISQPALTKFIKNELPDLDKTLTDPQKQVLLDLQADLERQASLNQRNIAPTGSPTAANLNSDKIMKEILSGKLKNLPLGKYISGLNEKEIENLNIEAFRDPKLAAELMEKVKPIINKMPLIPAMRERLLQQMVGSALAVSNRKEDKK